MNEPGASGSGAQSAARPLVHHFYHPPSGTVSYVVREPEGPACAIVDPVLDFNAAAGRTAHESADALLAHVREEGLEVAWILETHAHADHISAAPYLQGALPGARIGIGRGISEVQRLFKPVFGFEDEFPTDGSQFDQLFEDGETFAIGALTGRVLHTPGHTPACVTYVIGDAAFVGDTLFMPDSGSARADFPGGDAAVLYRSIQRILALPPQTRLFICHDYKPGGRELRWETTVAEQREANIHVHDGVTEAEYVELRETRDATLAVPALLLPSVQLNVRAGRLPPPDEQGRRFLKLPIDAF